MLQLKETVKYKDVERKLRAITIDYEYSLVELNLQFEINQQCVTVHPRYINVFWVR